MNMLQELTLARRLVERGVRFIELSCMGELWGHHGNLKGGHESMSLQVHQPIGVLHSELKSRGGCSTKRWSSLRANSVELRFRKAPMAASQSIRLFDLDGGRRN